MVDGDSVTVTGTNFSSPTLDLVDSNSLYIAPQIVDSSTTTTIEVLSIDDGDLNLVAGSPQSGIPKSVVDDSAIGTTPYVIRALVDSTFTGPSIDYSASSDYWVIQTMASSADTSVGSFFDPLKIAVEDDMQLAIPKVISGVNTILYSNGSFEIDQDVVVAIPGIYFSPSTGQYSLHTMVTGEAVAGIVETCYDVDGVILPNGTSVTWAVYPNVAGLQSGGVLASGVTEITGGDGTLFINDPNVGIVDDIVLLAAVLPDDTTVMDIAVTVKDIGE
jgi:hypothetical protein